MKKREAESSANAKTNGVSGMKTEEMQRENAVMNFLEKSKKVLSVADISFCSLTIALYFFMYAVRNNEYYEEAVALLFVVFIVLCAISAIVVLLFEITSCICVAYFKKCERRKTNFIAHMENVLFLVFLTVLLCNTKILGSSLISIIFS